MNTGVQRLCIWSGITLIVLFGAGLLIAGFLPPPPPGQSADQVAQLYAEHYVRIRAGGVTLLIATIFWMPWVVVISMQLRRIEGGWGPLTAINLASGTLGLFVVAFPAVMWLVAAYRPTERSPETLQLVNDMAWLTFVGLASLVIIQNTVIGIAILRDKEERAYPRWAGYLNLWTVPLLVPGFCVYLFRSGPLSWNGIFAWWMPVVVFGGWFVVMIALTFRAVASEERQPTQIPVTVG